MSNKVFTIAGDFELESGETLSDIQVAYQTYGHLNNKKDNVVWAFHALSANADVLSWWPGLFGEHDLLNPKDYFIICANVLGSPYGSTHPESSDFPLFTVRDVVNVQLKLAQELEIAHIHIAIGGSFGGSQALEFAYSFKGLINNLVLIACAAKESAWGIAIHESQRMALTADTTFGEPGGGSKGIRAARAIGMLTYRSAKSFEAQQANYDDRIDEFDVSSYIQYQGEKFDKRFDALSYYYLSKCLDTHNIGRGRGGVDDALSKISTKSLVIGINTDHLLPTYLQKTIANSLSNGHYKEIESEFGHDGFLIETKKISALIQSFISTSPVKELSVYELKVMMDRQEDFQLIDVREEFEVEIASIGGELIPMKQVPQQLDKIAKDKKVVVYCRSGRRSAIAIDHIQQVTGHNNLFNLAGGILDWSDKIDRTKTKY